MPGDAAEHLAPLRWLLGEIDNGGGLGLTQTGALNRAFVIEASQRWEWWDLSFRGPNRQDDVWQLGAIHDLARHCGAARRRRRLQLTALGQRMVADATVAWNAVVPWVAGVDEFDQMMAETATLVLLDHDGELAAADLWPTVAELAAEQGWRVGGHGGAAPGQREVGWATRRWLQLGDLFGLVHELGEWRSRRIRLTSAGETAMVAYVRSRAAGPRSGLFA